MRELFGMPWGAVYYRNKIIYSEKMYGGIDASLSKIQPGPYEDVYANFLHTTAHELLHAQQSWRDRTFNKETQVNQLIKDGNNIEGYSLQLSIPLQDKFKEEAKKLCECN